jgi:hypothetical protein
LFGRVRNITVPSDVNNRIMEQASYMTGTAYKIYATNDWTHVFSVTPGHSYTMMVNPSSWYWDPHQPPVGPGGTGQTNPDMPVPNAPQGCLLWKQIGAHSDSGWWTAQRESIGTGVNASGDYYFRINDNRLDDNSGFLIMYVSIYDYPAGT